MIFLKIKRDIQFNLSQTKNTKNPVQTSVTSIRKTEKTCKKQQIFTWIEYSLFNTKTWCIIPQFPLLGKVLIENITINKYFIPHIHPKVFNFGIRPEKVKLLPLVKKWNKNENLIGILIIPGQKKEMMK